MGRDLWVLLWLMRLILAWKALPQVGQRCVAWIAVGGFVDLCFRICLFSCAFFTRSSSNVLVALWIVQRQADRCCASVSQVDWFRCVCFKDALRVSFYLFFWPPWLRFPFASSPKKRRLGSRSSGILATWPAHLSWVFFRSACMLGISARARTSVSGIFSCQLIPKMRRRQFMWKR